MSEKKTMIRRSTGAAALAAFAVILICVLTGHTAGFDDPVREFFYSLRSQGLTGVAVAITMTADKRTVIGLCILLLIIPATRMRFGIPLSAGALGVTIMNSAIKHLVQRPRPEVAHLVAEHGYSFPSGHSITSMFFYGLAIWLVLQHVKNPAARRALTVLLAIPMVLTGPTRIYLGVHYPTDVLGAWCLGFAAIILAIEIICECGKTSAAEDREQQDWQKGNIMNEELKKLSKDQLIELAEIYSKNWLACDGLWFQAVERRHGMDGAMDCDKEIWRAFTVTEAKRIKAFLGLSDRAGLEGLEQAMRFRLYANLNDEEYIIEGSKMIYRTLNCRVQRARSRKGMEWHPCKAIGEIEYAEFAKVIDDRVTCKCISCYPDITESEREGCCAWEFTLE